MLRRTATSVCMGWLLVSPWTSGAQQPAADVRSLAAQARETAKNFRPIAADEVAATRSGVARAMHNLEAFLQTGAAFKAEGWKRYLRWNELTGLVSGGEPPAAETVSAVIDKLRASHPGLELPVFTQLREALAQYAATSAAAADKSAAGEYEKRMEELATQLEAYGQDPAAGDAALAIGRTLGWLEANRQAPELVAEIRRTYGQPNFLGYASKRLAAVGVERHIDQLAPVSDNILGTQLYGTARMVGQTTLILNDNPNMASMSVMLGGTAWSNSVGYNGPVTVYTTGATSLSGQKQVTMSADGFKHYAAQASARTSSNINAICARHAFVERIAWRRAASQKGLAEQIGSQHAAARVAGQMNYEVGQPVAAEDQRYQEKVRGPLLRRGEFPEELTFSSTPERLQVRMRQEGPALIAAPNEPPGFSEDHDLAARAHESAVINYAQGLLAGYYLTDLELERRMRDDLKVEVPEELRVTDEKDPWAIRFAAELPARARFAGGKVWMAIRADAFYRGESSPGGPYRRALGELIEISAEYDVVKTDHGATLRRSGDVVISFPNARPEERSVARAGAAGFLRLKFRNLFKEEFVGEGLQFKGEWAKAGRLDLKDIRADNAWLVLGWNMQPDAPAPAGAAPTGAE